MWIRAGGMRVGASTQVKEWIDTAAEIIDWPRYQGVQGSRWCSGRVQATRRITNGKTLGGLKWGRKACVSQVERQRTKTSAA